jgi:hypothetical protein
MSAVYILDVKGKVGCRFRNNLPCPAYTRAFINYKNYFAQNIKWHTLIFIALPTFMNVKCYNNIDYSSTGCNKNTHQILIIKYQCLII